MPIRSSFELSHEPILTPHPKYTALGSTLGERAEAYRQLLSETLSDDDLKAIRLHRQQQRAPGQNALREMVEAKIQRFAGVRPANRPTRDNSNGCK